MSPAPAPAPRPSSGRALRMRLIAAPTILALVLGVLFLHDRLGWPAATDVLLLLVGGGSAYELLRLLRLSGRPVDVAVPVLACAALAGVGLLAPGDAGLRMELRVLLPVAALLALLLRHAQDVTPGAVERVCHSFLPVPFVGVLLSFTREIGGGDPLAARWLAWYVLVAKASDMGGWIVGKPFGRHKLIPRVSPGKSWEGLLGGLAASVAAALWLPGVLGIGATGFSVPRRVVFGLAVGGASVVAGILWSGWKRRLGAKDSSALLPEIGGLLDMVDSLLLAGPVAWLLLRGG